MKEVMSKLRNIGFVQNCQSSVALSLVFFIILTIRPFSPAQDNPAVSLGPAINSDAQEITPLISADEKTLFFARKQHEQNIGNEDLEDIWMTIDKGNQNWSKAIQLGRPINNEDSNIPIGINALGNTLFTWNKNKKEIRICRKRGRMWQFPRVMTIEKFDSLRQHSSFQVSTNGQYLLFSAVSPINKSSKRDLFVCKRKDQYSWSVPINLGRDINSDYDEQSAFLAMDGKTLYFTSKAFSSFGGFDLYVSRRLDDSWTSWSTAVNMGPQFNTSGDDLGISIPASGEWAYQSTGKDLIRIPIPKELQPQPVTLLSGKIINALDRQPVNARIVAEDLTSGQTSRFTESIQDGNFQIVLPYGQNLGVFAEQEGFFPIGETIDLGLQQAEELDYDAENALVVLDNGRFREEYKTLDGMQLKLQELTEELKALNKKREAAKNNLERKTIDWLPASDPELEALRHKYRNYQQENDSDHIIEKDTSVIPDNFNFMEKGISEEDEELQNLRRRYHNFYNLNPEEEDEYLWEDKKDFEQLKKTAQEELEADLRPLVRKQLVTELLPEVKRELRQELDQESWEMLTEKGNISLDELASGLTAEQRSDSRKNSASIWQDQLVEDVKTALKTKVETKLREQMEPEIKSALHTELSYQAKKGLEEELQQAINEKLEQQKLLEEQVALQQDSLTQVASPDTPEINLPFFKILEKDLLLVPLEIGEIIPLHNVFFQANTAVLKPESYQELNRVLLFLQKHENLKVEVGGHTNGWLSFQAANRLSEERATVVTEFLIEAGIDEKRITSVGYGKTKPVASNETVEGRKKNQRIEIKITGTE